MCRLRPFAPGKGSVTKPQSIGLEVSGSEPTGSTSAPGVFASGYRFSYRPPASTRATFQYSARRTARGSPVVPPPNDVVEFLGEDRAGEEKDSDLDSEHRGARADRTKA
jgi:hypothetical protein